MEAGDIMRDKETGEDVKIVSIEAVLTRYTRNGVDGLVANANLTEHFDVLGAEIPEPS